MKCLYYQRHGESLSNVADLFATKPRAKGDTSLTSKGRDQAADGAKEAAKAGLKPDIIICSPLVRTRETAEIAARQLGYSSDIELSDLLIELQFGELEGQNGFAAWKHDKGYISLGEYKDAETIEALQQRAAKAWQYLQSLPQETILVVGHGAFGRALRRVIHNEPYTNEFVNGASLPKGKILRFI